MQWYPLRCFHKGANIYYIVYTRHKLRKNYYQNNKIKMHQSSKLLVTYKERSCFDHSDYQTHLMYAEVAWVLVSSETHVQPQIILDPDYLPNYPFVYYDYDYNSNGKIASKSCHRKRRHIFRCIESKSRRLWM